MNRRGLSTIAPDVRVSVSQIHGLIEDLDEFLVPYKGFWGKRSEPRETGCQYIKGLIANLPRKSAEPMAELFDKERKTFERFVGTYRWPDGEIRRIMREGLAATLGHPDGVLIFDPSAFPKQGRDSVGVARQWCGVKGKRDNCQIGCFLSYASPRGSSIVEGQLYLPEKWADNPGMREKCHVPPEIVFQKKWEIADQLLLNHAQQFPHSRILADAEFGRCGELRDRLAGRGEEYLMDIPKNLEIRVYRGTFLPGPTTPEEWTNGLLKGAWKGFNIRDTARGVLLLEGIMAKVVTLRDDNSLREEILVVKKEIATGEVKFALANGGDNVSLHRLLQDWSRRHTIEECFQRAKSDLGMDQYEVRSWVGWHHHITMVMLALWFLEKERITKSRSFSPSDGFIAGLDHGRINPAIFTRSPNSGKKSEEPSEKVFKCKVSACEVSKTIKIMQSDPPETLVN